MANKYSENAKKIDDWTDKRVNQVFECFEDIASQNLTIKEKREYLKNKETKFEKSF